MYIYIQRTGTHFAPFLFPPTALLPTPIGLYKIFLHFFLCVQKTIIPSVPPAHLQYTHYCNTIARRLRNICTAPDPCIICHLVMTISPQMHYLPQAEGVLLHVSDNRSRVCRLAVRGVPKGALRTHSA